VQFISWLDKGPLNAHEGFWFIDWGDLVDDTSVFLKEKST
jgi:hypothetical protein